MCFLISTGACLLWMKNRRRNTMPEHVTAEEIGEMKRLTDAKYDVRIGQYHRGEKQWDTNVSITMVIRGEKP